MQFVLDSHKYVTTAKKQTVQTSRLLPGSPRLTGSYFAVYNLTYKSSWIAQISHVSASVESKESIHFGDRMT